MSASPRPDSVHIVLGAEDERSLVDRAAKSGRSLSWIVPKTARPGDRLVFYFAPDGLVADGTLASEPEPHEHVAGRYVGAVEQLSLFLKPLGLEQLQEQLPELTWTKYPRSYHTVRDEVRPRLEDLLQQAAGGGRGESPGTQRPARESLEAAKETFERFFPKAGVRNVVTRALARSIQTADDVSATSWSVTLFENLVRLNVGMPLLFDALPGSIRVLARGGRPLQRALKNVSSAYGPLGQFSSLPDAMSVEVEGSEIVRLSEEFWELHLDAVRSAATRNPRTPHKGHSPGVIEYLESLGLEVPKRLAASEQAQPVRPVGPEDLERLEHELAEAGAFSASDLPDARRKVLMAVVQRRGQGAFRSELLRAYGGRCAITGSDAEPALEAAHIVAYRGPETNHVENGILLRADLHSLFDLDLLSIDEEYRVQLDPSLLATTYSKLHGRKLQLPEDRECWPSLEALRTRRTRKGEE